VMSGVQKTGLAALVLLGVTLGGVWGLRSIPPSETAIIDAAAAAYVAQTGGALTDCAARPSALEGVRLVVTCADGAWIAAFDGFGNMVELDPARLDAEPVT
jgi:hypothetical protein